MHFLKPLAIALLLASCSLNTNVRVQCEGKCDVEMTREAEVTNVHR